MNTKTHGTGHQLPSQSLERHIDNTTAVLDDDAAQQIEVLTNEQEQEQQQQQQLDEREEAVRRALKRMRYQCLAMATFIVAMALTAIVFVVLLYRKCCSGEILKVEHQYIRAESIKCRHGKTLIDGTTTNEPIYYEKPCETHNTQSRGRWYKFLGDGSCVTLSTCHNETDFDTRVRVYKPPTYLFSVLAQLEASPGWTFDLDGSTSRSDGDHGENNDICVAANDDIVLKDDEDKSLQACSLNGTSTISFQSVEGTWYLFLVDGFDIEHYGNYALSIHCSPQSCADDEVPTDNAPTPAPTSQSFYPTPLIVSKMPTQSPTSTVPTAQPSPQPTLFPTSRPTDVAELLEFYLSSISNTTAMHEEGTPQQKAFSWALEDMSVNNNHEMNRSVIEEIYILATFYYSTGGDEWKEKSSFLDHTKDICSWHLKEDKKDEYDDPIPDTGITCDDSGFVTIYSDQNSLKGTIPTELGALSKLKILILMSSNALKGTIPGTFGSLLDLEELVLFDDKIGGTLPSVLGTLPKLRLLLLPGNVLEGTIPSELGNLTSLFRLHLDYNNLIGTIPTVLGDLATSTELDELGLGWNDLSGSIPTEIGNLVDLSFLRLDHNVLESTIPSELGKLIKLHSLYLNSNLLTGTIPETISDIDNLEIIRLYNNDLHGDAEFLCSIDSREEIEVDKEKVDCSCCEDM